jgi:hypothetical protein
MGVNYICSGTMSSGVLTRNTCMCDVHGYADRLLLTVTNLSICHPFILLSVQLFFHSIKIVCSMFNM